MRVPATPCWGPLVLVVGGPSPILVEGPECSSGPFLAGVCCWWWWVVLRQAWLRARGAVPCHSWLGPAVGGYAWYLASPGRGPWAQLPAIPRWGLPVMVGQRGGCCWCHRGAVGRGSCVFLVCGMCVRVLCVLWSVVWFSWSIFWYPGVCVFLWVWCVCHRCMCALLGMLWSWLGPSVSWLWASSAVSPRHSLLGSAAGSGAGSSSTMAEGSGCSSRQLLAVVFPSCWRLVPRKFWLRSLSVVPWHSSVGSPRVDGGGWSLPIPGGGPRGLFPAIPGWGLLVAVVGGPPPILAEGPLGQFLAIPGLGLLVAVVLSPVLASGWSFSLCV